MSDNKGSFEVNVGGLELSLRTTCDKDSVKKIVDYVESRFSKSLGSIKSKSVNTAAILTALNIAEENFVLRKNAISELTNIENKAKNVLGTLDSPILTTPTDTTS